MAYDIIYDKLFIEDEGKYAPFFLVGPSNVWETDWDKNGRRYERRVRNWRTLTGTASDWLTKEELLKVSKSYGDLDEGSAGSIHNTQGKWLSAAQMERQYLSGMRNAVTPDFLRAVCVDPKSPHAWPENLGYVCRAIQNSKGDWAMYADHCPVVGFTQSGLICGEMKDAIRMSKSQARSVLEHVGMNSPSSWWKELGIRNTKYQL